MKTEIKVAIITGIFSILAAFIVAAGTISNSMEDIKNAKIEALKEIEKDKIMSLKEIEKNKITNLPVGTIIPSMFSPKKMETDNYDGIWILADGREISINTKYYKKTGSSRVPDLRGMFLRGLNEGRTDNWKDPEGDSRGVGSFQEDQLKSHSHGVNASYDPIINGPTITLDLSQRYRPSSTDVTGGNETRPKNVSVYYYIKIN